MEEKGLKELLPDKEYLGDGVYIEWNSYHNAYRLYTHNGLFDVDNIYLEPEVVSKLQEYFGRQHHSRR